MNITSIVKVSTQGVSHPYVCTGEDGQIYWCKGNHTGLRALMLEWLCARIARAVSLPVPEFHIARLSSRLFRAWQVCNGESWPVIVTETNPYVFASRNVEAAKDVIDVSLELREIDPLLLAKIYLFDEFIRNTDRTDVNSNLLINGGLHVIDHNNALDKDFDVGDFAQNHILRRYFQGASQVDCQRFTEELRDTVTPSFLEAAWSEMPSAWTDAGESVISLGEVTSTLLGGNQ